LQGFILCDQGLYVEADPSGDAPAALSALGHHAHGIGLGHWPQSVLEALAAPGLVWLQECLQ
jgi:hypothetical protein